MPQLEILIALIGAHLLCDYVFQTDAIAKGKNSHIDPALFGVNWYYWMSAHAATHGWAVGIITGSVWLGVIEAIFHWGIDKAKCDKRLSLHEDQALHLLCKIIYLPFLGII